MPGHIQYIDFYPVLCEHGKRGGVLHPLGETLQPIRTYIYINYQKVWSVLIVGNESGHLRVDGVPQSIKHRDPSLSPCPVKNTNLLQHTSAS